MALPQRRYTPDDYFLIELGSSLKHEYLRGEIFAMAGATVAHNEIQANVLTMLRTRLRGQQCRAYGSDFRITTPAGFLTYPDLAVVCGPIALLPDRPDTATNPQVLVEILSDATREYDRGQKFTLYKTIPTLREYVLIEQTRRDIEHWRRGRDGAWTARRTVAPDATLRLNSLRISLPLVEIYDGVEFKGA